MSWYLHSRLLWATGWLSRYHSQALHSPNGWGFEALRSPYGRGFQGGGLDTYHSTPPHWCHPSLYQGARDTGISLDQWAKDTGISLDQWEKDTCVSPEQRVGQLCVSLDLWLVSQGEDPLLRSVRTAPQKYHWAHGVNLVGSERMAFLWPCDSHWLQLLGLWCICSCPGKVKSCNYPAQH